MPKAVSADPDGVHSNIVLMTVGPELSESELGLTASVMCERLRDKGVLALAVMPGIIRFVTHSQVRRPWIPTGLMGVNYPSSDWLSR